MLSWREIASQICSSLTKPCSISTRPRRRPVFFCCSSEPLTCSCEITCCATSVSPSLIFSGRPIDVPLPPCAIIPFAKLVRMKAFASRTDLQAKRITFQPLSANCRAFTAEGDPNSGVIVGDDAVIVIDAQATPLMAREVIRRIRKLTSKPIRYVVLTHYHAVRVLGASAYRAEHIIASEGTLELIRERGAQDMRSEIGRFPRLFRGAHTIPGVTWPTLTFRGELSLRLGRLEVQISQPGPGHTAGDTIVWVPSQRVLFSGDLVEFAAGIYTGDAQLEE